MIIDFTHVNTLLRKVYIIQIFLAFSSLTLLSFITKAQNDTIANWNFNEQSGLFTKESVSGMTFQIVSREKYSERVKSVIGNGLRTDGYSTWMEGTPLQNLPGDNFSVSGWIALEAYPGSSADIWSQMDTHDFSGMRLGISRFGKVEYQFSINKYPIFLISEQSISHNKWHFIAATLNTVAGRACLYVDGELVQKKEITKARVSWPATKMYIGRSAKQEKFIDVFPVNVLNGIIDEVVLWNTELQPDVIRSAYQKQKPLENPDMNTPAIRFAEDFNRPKYHAIPKSGWTNEPHGLVYFNGVYHFFNQKNGNGPFLRNINWGHQISRDLLHWKDTATVLWPQPGYDQLNVWSGHLVVNNNIPTIFYTGVDVGYKQTICTAYSLDSLKTFVKHPANPLISQSPSEYISNEFRDPYVFKEDSHWYMIVGSGLNTSPRKGSVILYKSADLIKWNYVGPLFIGDPVNDETGVFWELPVFHKIGKKYVLMVNRVPLPGIPAKTFYWVGKFENEKFIPDTLIPRNLELINWLLVPCINYDEEGRLIAIGFIADQIPLLKQYEQGWTHCFSLPRVWTLQGDTLLVQSPHPYLEKLKTSKTSFKSFKISPSGSGFLGNVNGTQLEIEAQISRQNAGQAGFVVGKSMNNKEFTKIYYDYDSARIVVDRTMSSEDSTLRGPVVSEKFLLANAKEINWKIFIDGSVLEVFINNASAFVSRIFPTGKDSNHVDLFAKGGAASASVTIWKLALSN